MGARKEKQNKKFNKRARMVELIEYKRKVQAFLIHYDLLKDEKMINRFENADRLLDVAIKSLIQQDRIKQKTVS